MESHDRPARLTFSLAAALGACAMLFAACAPARHPSSTMTFTEQEDVDTLNPILTNEATGVDIDEMTAGYLVLPGAHGTLIPYLTTRVPTQQNGLISRGGRTITYDLRRGVRWSDGKPFTAADVLFSTHEILNPNVNVPSRTGFDDIASIQAPTPYRVVVHLKTANAGFTSEFMYPAVGSGLLPEHVLRGVDVNRASYNGKPLALGPFEVADWTRGSAVVLDRNPYWWGPKPALKHVVYRIVTDDATNINQLHTGELDAFARPFPILEAQLAAIPNTQTLAPPSDGYEHLDFNLSHAVVQDRRVREAIAMAIDRGAIVRKVNHGVGTPACGVIPASSWAYDRGIPCEPYDLARAGALLDQAGWRMGRGGVRMKNGQPLELRLVSTAGEIGREETAVMIQSELARIGVRLNFVRFQANQLFAHVGGILADGKFDMGLYTWYWGSDPASSFSEILGCANRPPAGNNFARYCNPQVDALIADAQTHYDPARRKADYDRAQTFIAHDIPQIVLYDQPLIVTYNDRLRGIAPNGFNPFPYPWLIAAAGSGAR